MIMKSLAGIDLDNPRKQYELIITVTNEMLSSYFIQLNFFLGFFVFRFQL